MSEESVGQQTEQDNGGVEKEARVFGWVPKEEFRGSDEAWVDAETFVKRGKEINPILRANNERLKKEMELERQKHSKEIADIKATAEEFKQFQKEAYERKQTEAKLELETLKQQRKEAMREGDADRVVELEDRIEEVKEEQAKKTEAAPAAPVPEQTQIDPTLSDWMENNKWFGNDIEASEIANGVGSSLRKQFPSLSGKEFFEKLDERLQQRLPELYENPNQARATVEGSSGRGAPSSKKKSYENLPADAKAACDKFVQQGLFKSKQEYVDLYDWN